MHRFREEDTMPVILLYIILRICAVFRFSDAVRGKIIKFIHYIFLVYCNNGVFKCYMGNSINFDKRSKCGSTIQHTHAHTLYIFTLFRVLCFGTDSLALPVLAHSSFDIG